MLCALSRDVCEGFVHQLCREQSSTLAGIVLALNEAQHMALTSVIAAVYVGPPLQLPPKNVGTNTHTHTHQ